MTPRIVARLRPAWRYSRARKGLFYLVAARTDKVIEWNTHLVAYVEHADASHS